jgi:hypothetical protein
LDGVDNYASAAENASLDLGTGASEDFTIETFFYVPDLTNTTTDTLIWKQGAYGLYILYSDTIKDRFIFRVNVGPLTNDYVYIFYNVDLTIGWHHVAAVYDNEFTGAEDLLALYFDGSQVKIGGGFDVTPGIYNSTSPVNIGAYIAINPSSGWMEEVRFSDVARYSGSYTVPTSPFTNDAHTRALWHFDEAVGATTFSDSSGHANTLAGQNGAQTVQPVIPPRVISGSTSIAQTVLQYTDGAPKKATTLPHGGYSFTIPNHWSGTVTPTHPCFSFSPPNRNYSNVTSNQSAQDYTPTLISAAGCSDIRAWIGGAQRGRFGLTPGASTRVSFTGLNAGSVNILSLGGAPIISAERVIYKVNGVNTSFSEMMGLPDAQLDITNWLPWYNNVDLDTQLRFGNANNATATVHVYIGGTERPGSPFNIGPFGSVLMSFAGVNAGPVKVVSNVAIAVSERVIYKVNGVNTSFSEMMALPNSQLNTTYWLPWYNSKSLDTQLRIANVSTGEVTVTVTVGGAPAPGSPFTLALGASKRLSFPNLDKGPVKIQSTGNIIAAERVIYKLNGAGVSFSEMMALPNSQLDTTYWLPWYNSKSLDTQLRIANVTGAEATVHVSIGGAPVTGSPFTIPAGGSKRLTFPSIDKGPVKIQSNQNIVAAERVIYKVNNVNTSFFEMMALPNSQLDVIYWMPHYNNVDFDTQLRFGVP